MIRGPCQNQLNRHERKVHIEKNFYQLILGVLGGLII
jgi:hypothetical protein